MTEQFTCISFDKVEFLLPTSYVVAGSYLGEHKDDNSLMYDSQVIPHLNVAEYVKETFGCSGKNNVDSALIFCAKDWNLSVIEKIEKKTLVNMPRSGLFALSFSAGYISRFVDTENLYLFSGCKRDFLFNHGISAVSFYEDKVQYLLNIDMLIAQFLKEVGGIK
ncbi:MAG: hypothetical protein MJ196_03645 [Treponemataceae bacterium]|nr:hypothetical protein [Treponemataceae bacterium]